MRNISTKALIFALGCGVVYAQQTQLDVSRQTKNFGPDLSVTPGSVQVVGIRGNAIPALTTPGALTWNGSAFVWSPGGGSGSVTSVSGTNANGFTIGVAFPTTAPNITIGVDPSYILPTLTQFNSKVDAASPLSTTYIPKAISANSVGDSSLTDDTMQVKTTLPFVAASITTGSGASGCNGAGCIAMTETAVASTPTPGIDILRANLSTHQLMLSLNGGAEFAIGSGGGGITALTGDVTASGSGSVAATIANNAVTTVKINNAAVTLAKIANAAASSKLLGSGASGSGAAYSEITLGSNLSMSGTTLNATGGTGSPAGSNTQVQYNASGSFGANSGFISDTSGNVNVLSLVSTNGISSGTAPVGCPTTGCIALSGASTAGTPTANTYYFRADSTSGRILQSLNGGPELPITYTVASGTATLGTSAIASGACATVVTVAGTGILTTDTPTWWFNADVSAVTGYAPVTTGGLALYPYLTPGAFNVKACNPTISSITPGPAALAWRVTR